MLSRFVKRKWGFYITLIDRKHFKVKLLRFWRGLGCSMQHHVSRGEVWLFLSGFGYMYSGPGVEGFIRKAGDYCQVDKGEWHQYKARENTWVLEIQYGEKCIEGDIVRL